MDEFSRRISSRLTPEQRKIKQKFDSAESISEMLDTLKNLESCLDKAGLGLAYCSVVHRLYYEYNDREMVLIFGKKALGILLRNGSSLMMLNVLWLLGSSCSKLNRHNESFKYLTWAVKLLEKLDATESDLKHSISSNLHTLRLELFDVKQAMGAIGADDECISYLIKNLEITEKMSGVHSKALAEANKEVSNRVRSDVDEQAALPFCLRALEIYLACPGDNSKEIAECSMELGIFYTVLGEPEKALQYNQLSQKILKKLGCTPASLRAEIDGALILIELGRFEEAVQALRDIVKRTETDSEDHIKAWTHLGRAFAKQGKLVDAKNCLDIVCSKLDKRRTAKVGLEFGRVAEIYHIMNEAETSISVLQKALVIMQEDKEMAVAIKNPVYGNCCKRLLQFLLFAEKFEEVIPYLEAEVESAKRNFGSWALEVGSAYSILGGVYFHTNKLQLAVNTLPYAKAIFEKHLGPYHKYTVSTTALLSLTFSAANHYDIAIYVLEELIKSLELGGPSLQDELDKITILLAELKEEMTCGEAANGKIKKHEGFKFKLTLLEGRKVQATISIHQMSWDLSCASR